MGLREPGFPNLVALVGSLLCAAKLTEIYDQVDPSASKRGALA